MTEALFCGGVQLYEDCEGGEVGFAVCVALDCWNHDGARVCDDVRLTVSCFTRTNVTRTRPELFEQRTTKDGVGEERRSEVMIVLD